MRRFLDGATSEGGSITEQYVFARTLASVINEEWLSRTGQSPNADQAPIGDLTDQVLPKIAFALPSNYSLQR